MSVCLSVCLCKQVAMFKPFPQKTLIIFYFQDY